MAAKNTDRENVLGFSTRAIHHGHDLGGASNPHHGALTPPVYFTSSYSFPTAEMGQELFGNIDAGFRYGRYANPTQDLLERRLADLEGGEAALAMASGMGAISAVMWTLLECGDEIIVDRTLYGASFTLFMRGLTKFGVAVRSVDMTNPDVLCAEITHKTKLIYFETPGNPNLQIIDIQAISTIAHSVGAKVVIDNTFASPVLQQPLKFGADIVVHSATKYLGGHGDLVAGAIIGSRSSILNIRGEGLRFYTGATISPFTAFLVLRGLKTLEMRMDRHSSNAIKVARMLQDHSKVLSVRYPGLPSSTSYDLADRQMSQFGGMLSFEIKGDANAGITFMNKLSLIKRAVSLGDAETLIQHPASMTHSTYNSEERLKHGIAEDMLRLSVGLENVEDIIADISQALEPVCC